MEPITTYTGSDGKTQNIAEMNNFHLLNAFVKMALKTDDINASDFKENEAIGLALKAEVLKRMDNRPAQA